ncbi:MAG: acetyltransferase [Patescibacteria group bacterium]
MNMMHIQKIAIVGAGGHGKVVLEALLAQQEMRTPITMYGWLDDVSERHGKAFCGYPIVGGRALFPQLKIENVAVIIALGDNAKRVEIAAEMNRFGIDAYTITHPSAVVSKSANIGKGCMIITRAVVHPDAIIGDHTIINTGAIVEHDNVIGSFCHIAPGVNLGGRVKIGDFTDVFTNATVLPDVTVGNHCVIGAGAVVLRDVPDYVTVVGNPARILKKE